MHRTPEWQSGVPPNPGTYHQYFQITHHPDPPTLSYPPFFGAFPSSIASEALAVARPELRLARAFVEVVGPGLGIEWRCLYAATEGDFDRLCDVMSHIHTLLMRAAVVSPVFREDEDFDRATVRWTVARHRSLLSFGARCQLSRVFPDHASRCDCEGTTMPRVLQ